MEENLDNKENDIGDGLNLAAGDYSARLGVSIFRFLRTRMMTERSMRSSTCCWEKNGRARGEEDLAEATRVKEHVLEKRKSLYIVDEIQITNWGEAPIH